MHQIVIRLQGGDGASEAEVIAALDLVKGRLMAGSSGGASRCGGVGFDFEAREVDEEHAFKELLGPQAQGTERSLASIKGKGVEQGAMDLTCPRVAQMLAVALSLLVRAQEGLASLACDGYTVPCAPDTSQFRAQVSGMVDMCNGLAIPTSGGGARTYSHFLKVGSAIDYDKRNDVYAAFRDEFARLTGRTINAPGRYTLDRVDTTLKCSDGTVYVTFMFGTSWGGIGIRSETAAVQTT
jgi:hypothetical protein